MRYDDDDDDEDDDAVDGGFSAGLGLTGSPHGGADYNSTDSNSKLFEVNNNKQATVLADILQRLKPKFDPQAKRA